MHTISDKTFKQNPIKYFQHIEQTGEDIVVTSNNMPIVKIVPFMSKKRKVEDVFKDVRGKIKYYDDVLTPETDEWNEG